MTAESTVWRRVEEIEEGGSRLHTEMLTPIGQETMEIDVELVERILREAGYAVWLTHD